MTETEKELIKQEMESALRSTERVGKIRAIVIGIFFPEFSVICGNLAQVCRLLKL